MVNSSLGDSFADSVDQLNLLKPGYFPNSFFTTRMQMIWREHMPYGTIYSQSGGNILPPDVQHLLILCQNKIRRVSLFRVISWFAKSAKESPNN